MESPDWYSMILPESPLPKPSTTRSPDFGHHWQAASSAPPSSPSFNPSTTTYYASRSAKSRYQSTAAQYSVSYGAPSTNKYDDDEKSFSSNHQDQIHHPISSNYRSNFVLQHSVAESDSFADTSGARSTPSDYYDENAENIDPNSSESQEEPETYPILTHSRPTNILRDSKAYPVSFTVAVPKYRGIPKDLHPIAAPVPLSYSARSKDVLSAMISPVQPFGFPSKLGYSFTCRRPFLSLIVLEQSHVTHKPYTQVSSQPLPESSIVPVCIPI